VLYLVRHPPAALAGCVENLWLFSDAPPHWRERILPTGTFELVINLHEDEFRIYDSAEADEHRRFSGAMTSGAYQRPFVIDTREHVAVIGVHFRPGGAFPLLGAPASLLADSHVDLQTLWGPRVRELRERLCAAGTPDERFWILEAALTACLVRPAKRHAAVQVGLARLTRRGERVRDVAALVGLSQRRFIELFSAEVGMTPKLYARVRRFQRAVALARLHPAPEWGALALWCGYYDQSHMIGDFTAFSDLSPVEFARHLGGRVKENHLALPSPRSALQDAGAHPLTG
jgi:AraC-like DNA-binding protein